MAERSPAQCAAQNRNFCMFLIKGAQGHSSFLANSVPPELLDKLNAVHKEILENLEAQHAKT